MRKSLITTEYLVGGGGFEPPTPAVTTFSTPVSVQLQHTWSTHSTMLSPYRHRAWRNDTAILHRQVRTIPAASPGRPTRPTRSRF